ncbi:dermonecrotic toxin domain-containing protein [Pseudomonas sp. Pseusp122]|uniref:dermonecrotic toxin domain-containing protein n=1 Tax=unclassified Pseudomonas TaxID=196821 RepID=UPI0039A440B5
MTNSTANIHHDFIKAALPGWYVNASSEMRKRLSRDIALGHQLQAVRLRALSGLKGLPEFARPLLTQALQEAFGPGLDIGGDEIWQASLSPPECTGCQGYLGVSVPARRNTWLENQREIDSGKLPDGVEQISRRTLLQAALSNYSREEISVAEGERFSSVRKARPDGAAPVTYVPNVSAAAFMRLCRQLDLGEQYQTHLTSVLAPSSAAVMAGAPGSDEIRQALNDSALNAMLVEAHIARMQGTLSPEAYLVVLSASAYEEEGLVHVAARAHYLNLLHTHIKDVLVFQSTVSQLCVLYIPGDPVWPFTEHGSFEGVLRWLRPRLRSEKYRQFFGNFVQLSERERFLTRLKDRLNTRITRTEQYGSGLLTSTQTLVVLDENVSLDQRLMAVTDLVTTHFATATLVRIREDARLTAVPVFEKDQASDRARLTELAQGTLTVLGFVPGLGEVVALVVGAQLLYEVFEGIAAWGKGDMDVALAHLESVAENAVMMASLSVIGSELVSRLAPLKASSFIDSLLPVTLDNGAVRLWSPNLAPFASAVELPQGLAPNAEGIFSHQGKHYLTLEGRRYSVRHDPVQNTWRVEPPRGGRFSPRLEHNGAGAWRHEGEYPAAWDVKTSFQRLGHPVASFSEAQAEQVMRVSGTDASMLAVLHLDRQAPAAGLADTIGRFTVDQQVATFIEQINDGSRFESADPTLQLKLLPSIRGWPKERVIHISTGQPGETLPVGRPIVVSQARVDQGKLLSAVLDALGEDEKAAIFSPRRPPTPMNLAFEVGRVSWDNQTLLFDTLNALREQDSDPLLVLLKRDFPGLPTAAAREVLAEADAGQRALMQITQRIPLALNERVRGYLQEARVNQALEGFFLASRDDHPDTRKLALHLLERLPGWPNNLRLEIRDGALSGPLLDAIGERSATQRRLLLKNGRRYQPVDGQGRALQESVPEQGNFFEAVLQALPVQARQAIGFSDAVEDAVALRERIVSEATTQRLRVAKILGIQRPKPGF